MKILCPVDFSSASLNAMEFAAEIGAQHQATLTLFHVFDEDEFEQALADGNMPKQYRRDEVDDLAQYAEAMLQRLADEVAQITPSLQQCDYILTDGPLEQHIVEYAEDNGYALIVMGTSGVKNVFEEYVGSTTVKTIERARCPVLCVPQQASYQSFRKVVYATDYQVEDTPVLRQLIALLEPYHPTVDVVHITEDDNIREEAVYQDFINEMRNTLRYEDVHFSQVVYEDVVHGIDHYVIEQQADLVAMLYEPENFLIKFFRESKVEKLAYFATYPMLIYQEVLRS